MLRSSDVGRITLHGDGRASEKPRLQLFGLKVSSMLRRALLFGALTSAVACNETQPLLTELQPRLITGDCDPANVFLPCDDPGTGNGGSAPSVQLSVGINGPPLISADWTSPYEAQYLITAVSNGRTSQYEVFWYVSLCSGPSDVYCWTDHPFQAGPSGINLFSISLSVDQSIRVARVFAEVREVGTNPDERHGRTPVYRTRGVAFSTQSGPTGPSLNLNCVSQTLFDSLVPPYSYPVVSYKYDYCRGRKIPS